MEIRRGLLDDPRWLAAAIGGIVSAIAALWAMRGLPLGFAAFWLTSLPIFAAGLGFGSGSAFGALCVGTVMVLVLSSLLGRNAHAAPLSATNPLAVRSPHFAAKAKRVIYLHLTGSPPNLDLFDYKPELVKRDGQNCPDEFVKGKKFAFTAGTPKLMGSPRTWARYGQGGQWLSDAIPHLHTVADDLCVIHSMNTDQFNHAPAELLLLTVPYSELPGLVNGLADEVSGEGLLEAFDILEGVVLLG